MKNLVVTLILLTVSSSSFSQEWVDAVKRARKSYQASDYKKALTYYQRAQKLAPDDVNLSDEIGQTSYKLGDFEKSEQFFQENTAAKSSKLEKAKSFHNIGNSRMKIRMMLTIQTVATKTKQTGEAKEIKKTKKVRTSCQTKQQTAYSRN